MNNLKLARAAKTIAALTLFSVMATPVFADQIEGNWLTESGDTAVISPCDDAFCITFATGEYSGKELGHLSFDGVAYSGMLVVPFNDQELSVDAILEENILQIKACPLVVFCKTQTWTKQ